MLPAGCAAPADGSCVGCVAMSCRLISILATWPNHGRRRPWSDPEKGDYPHDPTAWLYVAAAYVTGRRKSHLSSLLRPSALTHRPAHIMRPIRFGGVVAVGSAVLHTACERGWHARKCLPLT